MSISKWLDEAAVQQHRIERKARKGNFEDKEDDESFYTLLDLYEKGYDMVTWIVTDHEARCELCKFYDSHQTTWRLSEFLGLTRVASQNNLIHIIAAPNKPWVELEDSEKLQVLRTPITAYNYAKRMGYINIPEEVAEEISKDLTVAEYFTEGFLDSNETDKLPNSIVNAIANDASFVERLARDKEKQPNFPEDLKQFKGRTEEEIALEDQKNFNATLLRYNAPLFEHSHCNCACQLMVWKSDNPSDIVYVDAAGGIK